MTLIRHYVEMVAAMFVGMLVVGLGRDAAGLTVRFAERPGTSFLLMATDMALAMAGWMLLRRHSWRSTLEMSAVMYLPVVLVPLLWSSLMSPMAFMIAAHVVMVLGMLGVLLRHRCELEHRTCSRAALGVRGEEPA